MWRGDVTHSDVFDQHHVVHPSLTSCSTSQSCWSDLINQAFLILTRAAVANALLFHFPRRTFRNTDFLLPSARVDFKIKVFCWQINRSAENNMPNIQRSFTVYLHLEIESKIKCITGEEKKTVYLLHRIIYENESWSIHSFASGVKNELIRAHERQQI